MTRIPGTPTLAPDPPLTWIERYALVACLEAGRLAVRAAVAAALVVALLRLLLA